MEKRKEETLGKLLFKHSENLLNVKAKSRIACRTEEVGNFVLGGRNV